ncbi:arylamine N-acetyltransferase [Streptomyces sp. ODS28]|uniref:arylamine N-acetyltransferase family protein n=1 Tax=Streptomyces sp. ODS28 TaxID=3136688 RepID=UPI0031E58FC9
MQHLWSGEELDLGTYLARIGYEGEHRPTLAALRALHRAHVLSLPFENLNPVLSRAVPLDLPSLQAKMVTGTRGGYCYEHVTLFAAALERFGFGLTGLHGRVRMGQDKVLPTTHAMLRVETADSERPWLCDVGFGSSPLTPLPLEDGAEESAGDWRYRLERHTVPPEPGADGWILYEWDPAGGRWFDRHAFVTVPQHPVDYVVGSHFVASHERSPFVARPYIQRVHDDRLHVLDGLTLRTYRPGDGSAQERAVEPHEAVKVLEDTFGVGLDDRTADELTAKLSA